MFQKNLLLFTFCIFAYTTHAQIKNVDVNTDYTSLTYKLYSKSPLTKEVTYAELYPSKLNFLGPASIIPVMDPYLSLDAKKAKPNMPAKITFKYITQGLKNLTDDGNYVVNNNRYFPPRVEYYKRVSYTCPVTIEVYDSTNKLIKTIHVADSNHFFYTQYEKSFLLPPPTLGQYAPAAEGFASETLANDFFNVNKQKIGEKLEAGILGVLKEDVRKAIYSIYDFTKLQKTYYYYFEIEKKSKEKFPDIFEKTEKVKDLLKNFDEPLQMDAVKKEMGNQFVFFEEKLKDKNLPDDVKQLCRYTAATFALFINKCEASKAYYKEFYNNFYLKVPFGIYMLPGSYNSLYKYLYIYNEIQNNINAPVINLDANLDEIYYNRFLRDNSLLDQKIQARKKADNPENIGYDENRNKSVINAIWLATQCWSVGSGDYNEPADYIYKQGTNEIIGRKFLYPINNKKYNYITLSSTTGNMISGNLSENVNGYKISLNWEFNKLTGIKCESLSDFDYLINYDENNNMIGVTGKNLINGNIRIVAKATFKNGLLEGIVKNENHTGEKPWIRNIKTISFNDSATVVNTKTYFTDKPNIDKHSSTLIGVYKKFNGTSYVSLMPYLETLENIYNTNDDIEVKKTIKRNKTTETARYFYDNNKNNYKIETIEANANGQFIVKNVQIVSVPTNVPLKDYEKVIGFYKLNQADELIYEAIDSKYRNKVNGVWGEWKYFRM